MPLLTPPPNEEEPRKKGEYHPPRGLTPEEDYRRVQLFLNVAPWKCKCGITNFGRNLQCAKDTCKKPRPDNYSKTKGLV